MSTTGHEVEWFLEKMVTTTAAATHALVCSRDGLKLCHTRDLSVEKADQLAAIATGLQALSQSASAEFGDGTGGVRQSMTEFYGGFLFIVEAGGGAHLAVLAGDDADPGLIGHKMDELVEQIGEFLTAPPRPPQATDPVS